MFRARQRGRVANETLVQPNIVEARELKKGTADLVSYEHVFYTNRAKNHEKGTNKYEFEFDGAWRTRTGNFILGVRSMDLIRTYRTCAFVVWLWKRSGLWQWDHVYSYEYVYVWKDGDTIANLVEFLNERLIKQDEHMMYQSSLLTDWAYETEWKYDRSDGRIKLGVPEGCLFPIHYKISVIHFPMINDDAIFDIVYGPLIPCGSEEEIPSSPEEEIPSSPEGSERDYHFPHIIMKWDREDVLVTASFVTQTNLQHLGFTSTQYSYPKKYELPPNQTNFTLSLFSKRDMIPVELPEDGKDYIVLECIFFRE
jgi:hypothetical protein